MDFPILSSLILLPTIGALFLLFSKDKNSNTGKYVALFTSIVNFLISIYLWILFVPVTFIIKLLVFSFNQMKNMLHYIDRKSSK